MAEQHYDLEQIMREGEAASQLLNNPLFAQVVYEISNELVLKFYQCRADHTKEMVEIRREGNALAEITGRIKTKLARAQQLAQAQTVHQANQSGEQ
jgi:hypothetical protein